MTEGQHCEAHEVKIQKLEESDERQWAALDKLQHRLPIWATFVIGGLMSLAAGLLVSLSGRS